MYRFIKNKYIRNFIICFSLVTCLTMGFVPRKAQAVAIVDDAIMVGGVALAPEIGIALVGAGILYGGYKLAEPYVEDFKNYCFNEMKSYAIDKLFSIKSDSNGKQYATITSRGIDTVQSITKQATKTGVPVNTDATYTTPPTSSLGAKPYMYEGFYMRPYRGVSEKTNGYNHVYDTISIASGDTVNIYITHTGTSSYYNYSLKATAELLLQFYSYDNFDGSYMGIRYSYDGGATYTKLGSARGVPKIKEKYLYWGYTTTSNKVYALNAISGEGIEGNSSDMVASGSSVAVPISGQYETSAGDIVYGIDGAVGEVSGLGSDTSTDTSTDIDVGSGVNQGWLDKILTGINSIGDNVASAIQDVPILGDIFKILSKIWTWAENLVGDIANVFKGWLDEIISLLKSILSALTGFVTSLLDGLLSMLKSLCIPADTYFDDNFNSLKNDIVGKLGYKQYIDIFGDSSEEVLKDITMDWNGHTVVVVKMTTFEKFRNLFNSFCYGFMFFGLAIYNYNQIYRIFRNNSYAKMAQTMSRAKGE